MTIPLSELTHSLSQIGVAPGVGNLLALAGVSAVSGRSHSILHPLTGAVVTAAMNLILVSEAGSPARPGAAVAMRTFTDLLTTRITAARRQGEQQLRRERVAVEKQAEILLDRIRNPALEPQAPLTIPVPEEIRREDARAKAVAEAEVVSARLLEIQCEQQPLVIIEGLNRHRVKKLDLNSFDAAVCNFSTAGYALRQLHGFGPGERREVARFITSAWQGRLFATGVDTLLQAQLTNIWINTPREVIQFRDDRVLQEEAVLSTFHIVDVPRLPVRQAPDPTPLWDELITGLWKTRLRRPNTRHCLTAEAALAFVDLTNAAGFDSVLSEKILKAALLHHLATGGTSIEVGVESLEAARELVRDSCTGIPEVPQASEPNPLLTQMLDKLRVNGPMRKWEAYRKFHRHSCQRLDPVVSEAIKQGLITVTNGIIALAPKVETQESSRDAAFSAESTRSTEPSGVFP